MPINMAWIGLVGLSSQFRALKHQHQPNPKMATYDGPTIRATGSLSSLLQLQPPVPPASGERAGRHVSPRPEPVAIHWTLWNLPVRAARRARREAEVMRWSERSTKQPVPKEMTVATVYRCFSGDYTFLSMTIVGLYYFSVRFKPDIKSMAIGFGGPQAARTRGLHIRR